MIKETSDTGLGLVFSFDTTGSMYPCLTQVRQNIEAVVTRLFKEIPDLRIGIIAHGDYPECYELVLHDARSLAWNAQRARVLVLIGDAYPHKFGAPDNESGFDWENEARMLKSSDIKVYPVQCLNVSSSTFFYKKLAELPGGIHLPLHQFRWISDLVMGIAYQLDSDERFGQFEHEVRGRVGFNRQQEQMFDVLAG